MLPQRSRSRLLAFAGVGFALGVSLLPAEVTANPGVDGTRTLATADSARASATGTQAALVNPAGLSSTQQFSVEPAYQYNVRENGHGLAALLTDSLNNPRFGLGVGYVFTKGAPTIGLSDDTAQDETLALSKFGHQVIGVISVTAVRGWLYFGTALQYQYLSLRYLDDDQQAINAMPIHKAFGLDASVQLELLGFARVTAAGYNLIQPLEAPYTEDRPLNIENVAAAVDRSWDLSRIRRESEYARSVAHSVAVFPLGRPEFSINFDGVYDFSSYLDQGAVRLRYGGSLEYIIPVGVPLRAGAQWDGMGPGGGDDRVYVGGGTGFVRGAQAGSVGIDVGVAVQQQVTGPGPLDTFIGVNLGLRLHPDL